MDMNKEKMMELYERNSDSVYRICLSYMKNVTDAEDIVQETFVKVFTSNVELENERHERGWLILTASNLCKDNLKHWRRKNSRLEDFDDSIEEQNYGIDNTLAEIMKIPNKYKTVLFLYYYEGYSTGEISKIIKKKDATVRSTLSRGREIL